MFTTVANVQELTNTTGNTNISTAYIQRQINRAQGIMISKLSARYVIPIPSYFTNTITFTGTGSGPYTIVFTINGKTYSIAVIDLMTAEQAADAFRVAANVSYNTDFVTDPILSGTIVNLYSAQPNWPQGVNITAVNDPSGSGFGVTLGTEAQIQIPTLEHICTELAADYCMMADYGPEAQDTNSGWVAKLKETMLELEELHLGEMYLFDFAGNILPQATMASPSYFPTGASRGEWPDPTYNRATIDKQF